MAFPTGLTRRIALVIDHTKVGSGGVSAFSVLLTRASFGSNGDTAFYGANAMQADCGDLGFSLDSAGVTQLACDIIVAGLDTGSSGSANSPFQVRVNVPTISSVADTTIYMWYNGGGGLTQPGVNATYGQYKAYDANWKGYWPESAIDRTSGQTTLTASGTVTYSAGKIGNGYNFNATSFLSAATALVTTQPVTLIGWYKPGASGTTYWGIQLGAATGSNNCWYTLLRNTGNTRFGYKNFSGVSLDVSSPAWTNAAWNFVAGDQSAANAADVYLAATTVHGTSSESPAGGSLTQIGGGGSTAWMMDDCQVHNTARAAAWITTEYNQSNSPSTFSAGGAPATVGSSIVPTPYFNQLVARIG